MEFKNIVALTGKPGLFEVLKAVKTGIVIRNISTGMVQMLQGNRNLPSPLANISIFTDEEPVLLVDVMREMQRLEEEGTLAPNVKAPEAEIRQYVETLLPNYDRARVYLSDMQKLMRWYSLLRSKEVVFELPRAEAPAEAEPQQEMSEEEATQKLVEMGQAIEASVEADFK